MHATTLPSSGRVYTTHHLDAEERADRFEGLPAGVSRFHLTKMLRRGGYSDGFTPHLVHHLEVLVGYTREQDWEGPDPMPVVWLSVRETASRLGISREQVRRNERRLVELGAINHIDSGNHRRFGHRDRSSGRVDTAYGIDLRPLGAMLPELEGRARRQKEESQEWYRMKLTVSHLRRKLRGLMAGTEASTNHKQTGKIVRHKAVVERIRHNTTLATLREFADALRSLLDELLGLLGRFSQKARSKADVARKRWHKDHEKVAPVPQKGGAPYDYKHKVIIQNQHKAEPGENPTAHSYPVTAERNTHRRSDRCSQPGGESLGDLAGRLLEGIELKRNPEKCLPLGVVFRLAPADIWDGETGRTAASLVEAASKKRGRWGVSPGAWAEAVDVLGPVGAACALIVAEIKRRQGRVETVGGYLRGMVAQARRGLLNLDDSLVALWRASQ